MTQNESIYFETKSVTSSNIGMQIPWKQASNRQFFVGTAIADAPEEKQMLVRNNRGKLNHYKGV